MTDLNQLLLKFDLKQNYKSEDFYVNESTICVSDSIEFYNNSLGTIAWFKWEIEGLGISFEENPIFHFDDSGYYDAKLSVYNYNGEIISQQIENLIYVSSCFEGDVNMDGDINVVDVLLVVNLILSEEYSEIADLNMDSDINVLDILLLVTIILGEN